MSIPNLPSGSKVHSIADINQAVKLLLEDGFSDIWLAGEVSNIRRPASGHIYFTLKDQSAQIGGVIWKSSQRRLRFDLRDGLEVFAFGTISVFPPTGAYQIVVSQMLPKGLGAADVALRQLKEKLFALGWFSPQRKKPLPRFPRRIALVTSPSGAAVRDMIEIIGRRWPSAEIVVVPVRVQGESAGDEIAAAIALLNDLRETGDLAVDVMIVGRGGGSAEDLWSFNEEIVARAIFESAIPVVSAVGHQIDLTVADLVADYRAETPTHAATAVVPNRDELLAGAREAHDRLRGGLKRFMENCRRRLDELARRRVFQLPLERIHEQARKLDERSERINRSIRNRVIRSREILDGKAARIESVSPLNVLARGYSLTQTEHGEVVREAAQVRPGDRVRTRLHRGRLVSRIEAMEFEP